MPEAVALITYHARQRARGTTERDNGQGQWCCAEDAGAGHWHKDEECPLNCAESGAKNVAMTNVMPADVFMLKHCSSNLVGVADTACARTVAGSQWLQSYTNVLAEMGQKPILLKECEAYKFGTGKIHYSSFYVIVSFKLGGFVIQVRTLRCTRWQSQFNFRAINLKDYELATTSSGHPAIPIMPVCLSPGEPPDLQVDDLRLQPSEQHTAVFAVAHHAVQAPKYSRI